MRLANQKPKIPPCAAPLPGFSRGFQRSVTLSMTLAVSSTMAFDADELESGDEAEFLEEWRLTGSDIFAQSSRRLPPTPHQPLYGRPIASLEIKSLCSGCHPDLDT